MAEVKEEDDAVRSRRQEEREPFERRLDSLARLLSGRSICVAVSVLKGKLYITANELYDNSKDTNKAITSIKKVMAYFAKIANGEKIEDKERASLAFQWVYRVAIACTLQSRLSRKFISFTDAISCLNIMQFCAFIFSPIVSQSFSMFATTTATAIASV